MTQTPFVDLEEVRRQEEEDKAIEESLEAAAPRYTAENAAQTQFKEATPQENQAAGNVQPIKGPENQALSQLGVAKTPTRNTSKDLVSSMAVEIPTQH